MYYFHTTDKVFLHDSVHVEQIKKDKDLLIEVSDDDFQQFINLRANEHEIYVDSKGIVNATTEPKPSEYHTWNGKKWELTNKAKMLEDEKQFKIEQNKAILDIRIKTADNAISDLKLIEEYDEISEEEKARLKAWAKYKIMLNRLKAKGIDEKSAIPPLPTEAQA